VKSASWPSSGFWTCSTRIWSTEEERDFILCGDVNIAHKEIDLKNWKSNQKNSGFLPEERAWMTKLLDEAGMVDVYRNSIPLPPTRPTPGGATGGRPMRKTWGGGWTTTWHTPNWPHPTRLCSSLPCRCHLSRS
jgi:hypothetical protein